MKKRYDTVTLSRADVQDLYDKIKDLRQQSRSYNLQYQQSILGQSLDSELEDDQLILGEALGIYGDDEEYN